jgi:uncharacterized protein YbjT (DUF2867 family)
MVCRSVLVVGGTRGTGLLIARLLAERGYSVRVLARDPARASTVLGPAVQIVHGDITNDATLPNAIEGAAHIVFTAGCRSGHPASEAQIKATEYNGVLNTLAAATNAGFAGRFMYMTSSGVQTRSLLATALNLYKGNTLAWRHRAETAIRASGLDYTVIRTGMLLNGQDGRRAIRLTQEALPLSIRHRICRADVAQVFVTALEETRASRATFEIVWSRRGQHTSWIAALQNLRSDAELSKIAS